MGGGGGDGRAGLAEGEAGLSRHPADLLERVVARRVPLEELSHQGRMLGVGHDHAAVVRPLDVEVAERREGRPQPLLRLLAQAFADLLAQVVDVVFGHQHADAVHELLGGAGVGREDDVLFDEVDLQVEVVNADPVLEVAVEAVGLLHQQQAAGPLSLEEAQHLRKVGPARLLGRLYVHELAHQLDVAGLGVVA